MTDWNQHWSTVLNRENESDFLAQVAKTVGGVPISPKQLEALIDDICRHLDLNKTDRLLDICCGNGLVTNRCAHHCQTTLGVDFSLPLIDKIAPQFAEPNLAFTHGDLRSLSPEILGFSASKVLIYEALQFFELPQAKLILRSIANSSLKNAPICLGSIPRHEHLWDFYDTPERKRDYEHRKATNSDAVGHWWSESELSELSESAGYTMTIKAQNPILHTAHYRSDVVLHPSAS